MSGTLGSFFKVYEPMTSTMTKPAPKAQSGKKQLKVVTLEEHVSAVKSLKEKCFEVQFTVHGLPKSRKIGGKMATEIAKSVKGKTKGVRASKSIFTSEHPAVSELNAVIRQLDEYRNAFTIVKSADVVEDDSGKSKILGGVRLIFEADHQEFYEGVIERAKRITDAAAKVQHAVDHETTHYDKKNQQIIVPSIKEMDKMNCGDAWDASDYPEDVTKVVGVTGTDEMFREYHVSTTLAPEIYARAEQRLMEKLSGDLEAATVRMVDDLNRGFGTLLNELVNRVRIDPVADHPWKALYPDAEVIKTKPAETEDEIYVYLSYKTYDTELSKEAGKPVQTRKTHWVGPISEKAYQEKVRPTEVDEQKKIFPNVIEGILKEMQEIRTKKKQMLGAYGDNIDASFDNLAATLDKLRKHGDDNASLAQKVATEVKSGVSYRKDLATAITDAMEKLGSTAEEVRVVRRKVTGAKKFQEMFGKE